MFVAQYCVPINREYFAIYRDGEYNLLRMDAELRLFRKTLKTNGYFNTRARYRLFLALQQHTSPTIKGLIKQLKTQDQATVYRNLKLFEKLGIISILQQGWNSRLELSDIFHHHHHHFSCVNCGRVIVLKEDLVIEKHIAVLARRRGFKAVDHQLEIRGLCQKCNIKN